LEPVLWISLAPVILLAYAAEVSLGFGAALLAVSLGTQFYPLDRLVPVLAVLNVLVTGYMTVRHHGQVAWPLLLRQVLPRMILGAGLGLALFPLIEVRRQKQFYLLAVGVWALVQLARPSPGPSPRPSRWGPAANALCHVLAGAAQALYSTGGPLLVLTLARLPLGKGELRSSLCAVWAGLNSLLVVYFIHAGRLDGGNLLLAACLAPLLPLGVQAGEWLHKGLPESAFRRLLWWLLLAAAGLGLWRG
jgi:hypothetical protein